MFNIGKLKFRDYWILFLVFCVASSKGIIIYNEEILVALSFFLFCIVSAKYFSETITNSLQERSDQISFQLSDFHRLKEQSLRQLLDEHKQVLNIKRKSQAIGKYWREQLRTATHSSNQSRNLLNRFASTAQQKLSTLELLTSKAVVQQRVNESICAKLRSLLLLKKQKDKQSPNKTRIVEQVKQAITALQK